MKIDFLSFNENTKFKLIINPFTKTPMLQILWDEKKCIAFGPATLEDAKYLEKIFKNMTKFDGWLKPHRIKGRRDK